MSGDRSESGASERRVILEELRKVTTHPTAAVLHGFVRRRLPETTVGMVLRNLENLARAGVIQKLEIEGEEARFDGNPKPHYHVRCVRCGRVDDVGELSAALGGDGMDTLDGYEILGHRLELVGVCPECRRSAASEGGDRESR